MATDFIMPRLPDQQPHALYCWQAFNYSSPNYQATATPTTPTSTNTTHISPLSTSSSASPTSPRSCYARRTRPMYMPAVLRPTEYSSQAPAKKVEVDEIEEPLKTTTSARFGSLSGLGALSSRLSRRSTGGDSGSAKFLDGEWDLDMFPKPTALPTRKHWKPDTESTICDEPSCLRHFNYFTRRHHCRRCGNIFCDAHSAYDIPLDQDANYNPKGAVGRACKHCYTQFATWRSRTNSQESSVSTLGADSATSKTAPASPLYVASPPATPGVGEFPKHADVAAASVPRDWSWSTF